MAPSNAQGFSQTFAFAFSDTLNPQNLLATAMLFSVDSMTTRGASGVALHQNWHAMGALEAVSFASENCPFEGLKDT